MCRIEMFRARRAKIYGRLFGAGALCAAGLLTMPALVFNPDAISRALQFFWFWFLCLLCGRKTNPLLTAAVLLTVTAFNLVVPYGRVLFAAGPFRITEGALLAGIQRAATLEGLLMLSKLTVRKDLRLPGFFGHVIGESFRLLSLMTAEAPRVRVKNLFAGIDGLLLELDSDEARPDAETPEAPRTTPAGFVLLGAGVLLSWLPCILAMVLAGQG